MILGEGTAESQWIETLRASAKHEILGIWPAPLSPQGETDPDSPKDLDAALALNGVEAVVVGGPISFRDEALRRTAAAGLHAIALHPPGINADPYYQVALSREETGSIVVPDLPLRLHPKIVELAALTASAQPGDSMELLIDLEVVPSDETLVLIPFSIWADVVRFVLGEITTISAFGEPPGDKPTRRLTTQLRAGDDRRCEVRISQADTPSARLRFTHPGGTWSADLGPELADWDPHLAILTQFEAAVEKKDCHPNLLDGTRAMELAEGVGRSLRRGRMVDLHYEKVSEEANFKTVMTSLGCMILLGILVALPLSLAGPALGLNWMLYLAYAIPPILIVFGLIQLLKFGVKPPQDS